MATTSGPPTNSEQVTLSNAVRFGRIVTESSETYPQRMPLSVFLNGHGYEYVQARINGEKKSATIHQLTMLAKDREPECDPEECECSRRGPCPYRVFSDGAWQVHHEHMVASDSELAHLLRRFNYPDNLSLLEDDEHGRETRSAMSGRD